MLAFSAIFISRFWKLYAFPSRNFLLKKELRKVKKKKREEKKEKRNRIEKKRKKMSCMENKT